MNAPWKPIRRKAIADKVRDLRRRRGFTQAELAARLGMSQANLSLLEKGEGSFTAEQFLEILQIFNVPVQAFSTGKRDVQGNLQNALARQGASHLYEDPGLLPSESLEAAEATVREALLSGQNPRLITSLAPVLTLNHASLNLPRLWARFVDYGLQNRLGWVLDNTIQAIQRVCPDLTSLDRRPLKKAEAVFTNFLAGKAPRHSPTLERTPPTATDHLDYLDSPHASAKTLLNIWTKASPASHRWLVASSLQVEDFASALQAGLNLDLRGKRRHDAI